jgi:hypothetical protein
MLNFCHVYFEAMCLFVTIFPFLSLHISCVNINICGLSDNPHISDSSMSARLCAEGGHVYCIAPIVMVAYRVICTFWESKSVFQSADSYYSVSSYITVNCVHEFVNTALLLCCSPLILFDAENGLGICAWGFYSNAGLRNQTQFFKLCFNFVIIYTTWGLIMGLFCVIVPRYRGFYVTMNSFVFQLWRSDQELKLIFIQM